MLLQGFSLVKSFVLVSFARLFVFTLLCGTEIELDLKILQKVWVGGWKEEGVSSENGMSQEKFHLS